ncbi:MAG: para-aminobenzoate synthetase component 1, partial [Oceanospirillaceae bacterium]
QPRSSDPLIDQANIEYLHNSEKDKAENLMIVDLMRNDISKSCALHSVKVPALFAVESYQNVHHLVSTVTGQLDQQASPISLLRHCFPGGSITGAPKIRAMEIIEELEPHRRSIYCGSIGYISLCGRMDSSITIRTLLVEDNRILCWAGGGIVADSEITAEYQETFDKVNNLLNALQSIDNTVS